MSRNHEPSLTFTSMGALSAATGVPLVTWRSLKESNTPGFDPSGRVDLAAILAALLAQSPNAELAPPLGLRNWGEALRKAQAERQQVRLEQERGRLVDRAFVATAIHVAGQRLHIVRMESELHDAVLFAGTNGDTAECRTILKGIWDRVLENISSLASTFGDANPRPESNEKP